MAKKKDESKKVEKLKGALRHVKDIQNFLTKDIWVQGSYGFAEKGEPGDYNDDGEYCLMGASYRVDGPAEELAQKYMLKEAKTRFCTSVEEFNDDAAESFEDIVDFLKATAKRIRADIRAAA